MENPKLEKHIVIGITEDERASISISPSLTAEEAILLTTTLANHILHAYTRSAAKQIKEQAEGETENPVSPEDIENAIIGVKESFYNYLSVGITNVLEDFMPDTSLRSKITTEALLRCENEIIEEEYDALTDQEKEENKAEYEEYKARLKKQMDVLNEERAEQLELDLEIAKEEERLEELKRLENTEE